MASRACLPRLVDETMSSEVAEEIARRYLMTCERSARRSQDAAFHTAIELDRLAANVLITMRTLIYRCRLQLKNSKSKWAVHEMLCVVVSIALRPSVVL